MFFERKGESIHPSVGFEILTTQSKEQGDGHFEDELIGNVDVPDPKLFKLDYLLQNNVSLKQVNTKILGGSFEDLGQIDDSIVVNDNVENPVEKISGEAQ